MATKATMEDCACCDPPACPGFFARFRSRSLTKNMCGHVSLKQPFNGWPYGAPDLLTRWKTKITHRVFDLNYNRTTTTHYEEAGDQITSSEDCTSHIDETETIEIDPAICITDSASAATDTSREGTSTYNRVNVGKEVREYGDGVGTRLTTTTTTEEGTKAFPPAPGDTQWEVDRSVSTSIVCNGKWTEEEGSGGCSGPPDVDTNTSSPSACPLIGGTDFNSCVESGWSGVTDTTTTLTSGFIDPMPEGCGGTTEDGDSTTVVEGEYEEVTTVTLSNPIVPQDYADMMVGSLPDWEEYGEGPDASTALRSHSTPNAVVLALSVTIREVRYKVRLPCSPTGRVYLRWREKFTPTDTELEPEYVERFIDHVSENNCDQDPIWAQYPEGEGPEEPVDLDDYPWSEEFTLSVPATFGFTQLVDQQALCLLPGAEVPPAPWE